MDRSGLYLSGFKTNGIQIPFRLLLLPGISMQRGVSSLKVEGDLGLLSQVEALQAGCSKGVSLLTLLPRKGGASTPRSSKPLGSMFTQGRTESRAEQGSLPPELSVLPGPNTPSKGRPGGEESELRVEIVDTAREVSSLRKNWKQKVCFPESPFPSPKTNYFNGSF